MPYKSDAQRRFFHTDTAKKAGITDKEVKEFDQTSKGMKLPEKKMADGGDVPEMKDDKSTHDFQEGFKNGIQGDWEKLKSAVMDTGNKMHENYEKGIGDNGNLKGLQNVANKAAGNEKMAYGGETNPKHETIQAMENNPTAGFADGGDVDPSQFPAGGYPGAGADNAAGIMDIVKTLGLRSLLPGSDMTQNLASGIAQGVQGNPVLPNATPTQPPQVDNDSVHKLNMGTALSPAPQQPQMNPISQATQTMNNTPPTSPDIYAGIGAPNRAALANQLLNQKAQPGNLAVSGAGGLADAITSAFGRQPTNFQGNIRNAQAQNVANRLNVVDTQRQQVMQDIQAKIAVQEADPNSPYSTGMRQFLNAQGLKVPSGLSAAMLKQTLPDVTKIFDAKMQALTAQGGQAVEAGKALMGETLTDWLKEQLGVGSVEQGENYLEKRVGGTNTAAPNASGWKVVR